MVKRSKMLIITLSIVLVVGLAGTGIAMAKSRIDSGSDAASNAVLYSGQSEKYDISGQDNAMRRGGMRGGPRMQGGPGMGVRAMDFNRIAAFLGITTDELRTQLTGGKSLAQVATDKGKTAKDVVAIILAPWKEHLQVDVKYGYTSQAEADAMYQLRAVRTEAIISRAVPARTSAPGGQPGMGFRGFPGRGMMGRGPAGGPKIPGPASGAMQKGY